MLQIDSKIVIELKIPPTNANRIDTTAMKNDDHIQSNCAEYFRNFVLSLFESSKRYGKIF